MRLVASIHAYLCSSIDNYDFNACESLLYRGRGECVEIDLQEFLAILLAIVILAVLILKIHEGTAYLSGS